MAMIESPARPATVSFPLWGGSATVSVAQASALDAARTAVDAVLGELDRSCSRFRADSELAAVNHGAGKPVAVGETLLEATEAALRAARLTGGAVDPTVGRALIALGYDRDFATIPPASGRRRPVIAPVPGWRAVQLDRAAGTIRVPRGVVLDLGATAKALAADRAARAAHDRVGCGVLVSLAGDLAIAGPAPEDGWRIRVTDDHRAGLSAPGQWISLRSGGLATSSTAVRRWEGPAGAVHHLIDPASGAPADSVWRTASVAAGSCLDANIAATAAIIRGERALAWLEELGLPSRLVGLEGRAVHLAGWPAEGDDLA
jgi:thiamine biosynthesis lipoprotein